MLHALWNLMAVIGTLSCVGFIGILVILFFDELRDRDNEREKMEKLYNSAKSRLNRKDDAK